MVIGCASEDVESLHEAVDVLRRDGLEVALCEGLDHDPRRLSELIDQHAGRTLTIFTCHPIGSSAERLVVHAELRTRPRPVNS